MSLNSKLEARLVPSTLCACAAILVYDWMCTLDQEITYVWSRPQWSTGTFVFIVNRYLPFIDIFLALTAKLTHISPGRCLTRFKIVGWLTVMGIFLSEVVLMLRTLALWDRKRAVRISLMILAIHTATSGVSDNRGWSNYIKMVSSSHALEFSTYSYVQRGMLFYVFLLGMSLANILVPIFAPSMYSNWLASPQRVLHSVLCTRVLARCARVSSAS
ncbi:hypothetical protein C8F04DRAFT_1387757 [Mycena alexandri]|uniref:DUF6533 domain-containing protein n=1 Tax=Mycena alexandri TaxID=1745969 RepID=A0AAD6XFA4_9AGAR|nr:hypothetical protein C8F04DRAFT_1387757 [Mycena alexandri]